MGNALTDVDVPELIVFHRERNALATLALTRIADTSQYVVIELDSERNIVSFQEKPDPGEAISNLANTGIYVLEPEVLNYIPGDTFFDFAKDVFPPPIRSRGEARGVQGDFYWSDIGTLETYRAAQHNALSGKVRLRIPGEQRSESLWVDRSARLHPTVSLQGRAVLRQDAVVGRRTVLIGDVTVGSGSRVPSGATIKRSVLLPESYVGDGAYVEGCIIGHGYKVRVGEQISGGSLIRRARAGSRKRQDRRPRVA